MILLQGDVEYWWIQQSGSHVFHQYMEEIELENPFMDLLRCSFFIVKMSQWNCEAYLDLNLQRLVKWFFDPDFRYDVFLHYEQN